MIEISAALFFTISALVESALSTAEECAAENKIVTDHDRTLAENTVDHVLHLCRQSDLRLSAMYVERVATTIGPEFSFQNYSDDLRVLKERIIDELRAIEFLHIPSQHISYYKETPQFGEAVANKFPKTTTDIQEAAKCFALGRTTASVFHMMRVMEFATQFLGRKLNISLVGEKNWHKILDEVDKAIKALPTKNSRQKAKRNKFAEASAHLRMVKDAWRNDVMHPKETYTEEEAERVFRNVKDFMVHLAARL